MEWALLVLLSNLFYAWGGVNDKGFITKYVKTGLAYLILTMVISMVISVVLVPWSKLILPLWILALILFNSGLNVFGLYLWFTALSKDDVSRNAILINTIPIFTGILSFIFLGEPFPEKKLIGVLFLILAGFLASISPRNLRISKAAPYAILSAFFLGASNVINKVVLNIPSIDPITMTFWLKVMMGFLALMVWVLIKPKIPTRRRVLFLVGLNEVLFLLGTLAFIWAMAIGTPTLVSSLGSVYPIFVLTLEVLYSRIIPGFVPAELTREAILLKAFAVLLIAFGFWLVA